MTMSTPTTNPWIGLDSYREGQILYGRSREIRDLSMAVFHNRQTVVYGRSGIGKSSLLHAGIFPEARLRGCLPVSVRFNHSGETDYSDQLFRVISDAITAGGGVMTDTVEDGGTIRSLWEFFHRFRPEKDGQPLTPLIVVDQFEEIFTLSKRTEQVRAFFDELADLLNDVMPDYLQSAVQQTSAPASGGSMFDGLNFHLPDNCYMQDAHFHLVLSLREDYLSYLERYASRIPALKQNRYGLLPITCSEAMEIITQPRPGLVSEEVADTIIRQVVTEEEINADTPVDSAILSLFLSRLYEKQGDAPTIERRLVEEQGDALLEDFYAEIVAPLDKKTVWYLEDTLINADGHRENVTLETLYKNEWLSRPTVETLEKSHLLRLFSYGDVQRLEFAHDVLCPIIVRRRTLRVNEENHKRSRRRAIWAYFGLFIVVFMSIYAYENYSYREQTIKEREKKLSEVETSLILKGAQKMLDEHDIYGTIHLLLNSIGMDYYYDNDRFYFLEEPNENAANIEVYLRKAVDSLRLSKEPCVAKLHYTATEPVIMTLSPSGRLAAIPDCSERNFVVDSRTGAIVQAIAPHYPVELFTYHPISTRNAQQWRWVVRDGRIQFGMQNHDYTQMLTITDIHPDDSRCLIIGHNAVYDCFIRAPYWEDNGHTRLCLHDFPEKKDKETCVTNATYSEDGNLIAIQLQYDSIGTDSIVISDLYDYYLYDSHTGDIIQNDTSSVYAQHLIDNVEKRRGEIDPDYIDLDGDWEGTRLVVTPNSKFRYQLRQIYLSIDRVETDTKSAIAPMYIPSQEQEQSMRAHLDTLSTMPIVTFTRSFCYDETDTIYYIGEEKRYHWPLAISPDQKRVVMMKPMSNWDDIYTLYGVYPHNGAIFFSKKLSTEVRTIHFTEDNQYVIVNAGDADEQAIYLPPLNELFKTCMNMFFDWQMSSDDRYQTYLHMND